MLKPLYNPRFYQAVVMLVIYQFFFYIIPFIIFSSLFNFMGYSSEDLLVQIISSILAFLLLLLWLIRKNSLDLVYYSQKTINRKYLLPMFLTVLGTDIMISELGNRMQLYLPMNETLGDSLMGLVSLEGGLIKSFLLVVIIAPLLEETVFRGLILRGFLNHYSKIKAIIFSSLLFGFFHMNIWQFPGAFVWGIIAGWWYIKTSSLQYCILGHTVMNGIGFTTMVLKNQYNLIIPGFSSDYHELMVQPLWLTIMGLCMLLIGVVTLLNIFKMQGK